MKIAKVAVHLRELGARLRDRSGAALPGRVLRRGFAEGLRTGFSEGFSEVVLLWVLQ